MFTAAHPGDLLARPFIGIFEFDMDHQHQRNPGYLIAIGGAEDREHEKPVLQRLIELAGNADPCVAVITAASAEPDVMWEAYDNAFADLGVHHRRRLDLENHAAANNPSAAWEIEAADVVFMTGGDQLRLLSVLADSAVASAMWAGFDHRRLCIAGTSAGAAVMADHMVAHGANRSPPTREMVNLAQGLGLLHGVVIDQHFSQRRRLPRLLSALAHQPGLLGLGIDEDTALVVRPGDSIEVIGTGAVTVLDGGCARIDSVQRDGGDVLQLERVVLHLLPAGRRYHLHDDLHGHLRADGVADPLGNCGIAKLVSLLTAPPTPQSRGQHESAQGAATCSFTQAPSVARRA